MDTIPSKAEGSYIWLYLNQIDKILKNNLRPLKIVLKNMSFSCGNDIFENEICFQAMYVAISNGIIDPNFHS